ncbi:serine hydrolase domain-containing protein [Pedobacter sp. Du54]|uniref:serine hydrolase domain-containing protein n=1 Tax=Pedobacter anseongensis TaxID=3133439 RepID=UPI0030AD2733
MKLLYTLFLVGLLHTIGNAQTVDKAKLDQFFDRLAENNKAMGSLVIAKDGNLIYSRSIGYSEINETLKNPLTLNTRYRIASITKMYTAVLIFQLVEEGKLKLTDVLSKFYPQIASADKITIAQILSHSSGIHDALIDPNLRSKPKTSPITKDEIVTLISKASSDFEPGTKHAYSNSGYAVLGLIIEKVTGKPYEEVLRQKISSKLGLKNTYIATQNINVTQNEALTYRYNGSWKQEIETHPSNLFGGGFMISTPTEMITFIDALFNHKLISEDHLSLMKTIKDGEGFGMEAFEFAGKKFYGHTGGADNYGAWLMCMPEEKLTIAYTTNAKVYPVGEMMKGIMNSYYNKSYELPTFESIAISTAILDSYTGIYATSEAPIKFTVMRKDNILYIQPIRESAAPLEATAQNKFRIEGVNGLTIEFDSNKKQLIMKRPNGERIFTKEN